MSYLRVQQVDEIRNLILNSYPEAMRNDDIKRRVESWLDHPNNAFEGKTPREYIYLGKVRRVRNYCEQLFY